MKDGIETERRYLVTSIDPDIHRAPHKHIVQAYPDLSPEKVLRVRVIDGRQAIQTLKEGLGVSRRERETELPLDAASLQLEAFPYRIEKVRYECAGWEVDFFERELSGLVLAEFEHAPDEPVLLPPWIHEAIDVTDSLSNLHLAKLAYDLHGQSTERPVRDLVLPRRVPRIVLTGGPCSGKSTIMAMLKEEFGDRLQCVPEVATIVIGQVGIRPPADPDGASRFNRTLYQIQRGLQNVSEGQALVDGKQAILFDRGTIDIAAYLPNTVVDLEHICRTTRQHEYANYDQVLCLETPPKDVYEANQRNNPARSETYEQAAALGERIHLVWSDHKNFQLVANGTSWLEKVECVRNAVRSFLQASADKTVAL